MRVRVNSARQDQLSGSINDLRGIRFQSEADADDLFVLDQNIRLKCIRGSDKSPVFDKR